MCNFDLWNILILIIQSVILFGQLHLSKKINDQTISREKGYFVIEESNYVTFPDVQSKFIDKFDLRSGNTIGFYVSGNSDVFVCGSELSINGRIQEASPAPYETIYTLNNRFNRLVVPLNLNESQLKKEYLDIQLSLNLKNCVGYTYTQIITMQFTRDQNNDISHFWTLSKYNMRFTH